MAAINLICIDVDGTLLDSNGEVPDGIWAELKTLNDSGMRLAICSGRPAFGITLAYAQQLDADGWHIFQNGASVMRPATGETNSTAIPARIIDGLIERSRLTGRLLELYTDHECAVEQDHDRTRRHAALLGIQFRTRPFNTLTAPIVRAQWLIPPAELDGVQAEPHEGLNLCPSMAPSMPDTTFVNMTAAGVDKGSALRAVAAAYGFSLARVMMIGDGNNDIGALKSAGYSVAMGNASAECLAAARFRVAHVDAGGLREALSIALRDA